MANPNEYNGGLPSIIDKRLAKHMDAEISKVTDRIAEIAKEASDKMFADKVRKAIGL